MLFFFLLLAFCTSSALCTIQITIPGQINANSNIIANWTRLSTDPVPKTIQKVKQDEPSGSLASDKIKFFSKHATAQPDTALSGNVSIPFNRAGIFFLQIYDKNDNVIATSRPFGVNPPTSFQVNTAQQLVTGVLADLPPPQSPNATDNSNSPMPSAMTIGSNSDNSNKSSSHHKNGDDNDDGGKKTSNKTALTPALTAAVVVVSVFLFICMTAILFYFLRKRLRRQRYLRERKAVQESFAPSLMTSGQVSRNATAIGTSGFNDLEKARPYEDSPSVRRFSIFTGSRSSYFTSDAATEEGPQKRRRSFPSIVRTSGTISTIQFNPQTERQIALEERIWELEEQMERIRKEDTDGSGPPTDNDLRLWKLKGQIESLRNYKDSAWALGMTDDMPAGLSLR